MAMKQTLISCLFLFLALILIADGAKVTAPPLVDCTSALMGMTDCLTFIENGSTIAKPEKTCCVGLAQVVKENVVCLCETFKTSQEMGIALDVNKTLSLPSMCNVKIPPSSNCNISLPSVSAPSTSPVVSPPSKQKNSPSVTPSKGKTSPSPAPAPSKGSATPPESDIALIPPPTDNQDSKSSAMQIKTQLFPFFVAMASLLSYHYLV